MQRQTSENNTYSTYSTYNAYPFRQDIYNTQMVRSQDDDYAKSQSQSRFQTITKGIVGLRNIGNTCFMNSVLQCLFNLADFNKPFLDGTYSRDLGPRSNQIPNEYSRLLSRVANTSNFDAVSPEGLKSAVEQVSPNFRGYAQQDASEFLIAILDGLSVALNRVKTKLVYKEMNDNLSGKSMQDLSQEWWDYSKSRESSIVLDHFQGQLLHTIRCLSCQYQSYAFDTFDDISVATGKLMKLADIDLERLIELFLAEEVIDDYYCAKCKKLQKIKRKFTIWRLPKILIIIIKRFEYRRFGSSKLNFRLLFPLEFDIRRSVSESQDPSTKESKYQLTGIVNHSGSLYGGHYTADGRNPSNGKWYRYNDSDVREIDIESQRYHKDGSASPYILFYSKIR